ncbi:metallophosphoesterase [Bacillus timonensis]|uniref:Metallophosphoesterase n=1 Tax=Bacillus timonensis TaxID=1033734 RepID=A0A4S3PNV7_9BACI|nr:metallophosphoesterase [Bacillus timonensis]THE10372.1 metallophosphoesterase [Bacillus timonensis]
MKFFIILIVILMVFYFLRKANKNTYNVNLNKIKVTPTQEFVNPAQINVLHLSDLHLENLSITPEELYNKVKDEKVDIIAITGDFLDRKRSIPKLVPYLDVLNKLAPSHGIYAVFGNHDYLLRKKNFEKLKLLLEEHGVKTFQNENETLVIHGHQLNIIGIDDSSSKRSNLEKSYASLKTGYKLVLTHDPNIVLEMKEYHFDYLLSGHFHGGQICYPKPYHLVKMGKLVRMKMIKGLHIHDGKPFYINEGLGQTGVNIRVRSNPEITIHTLTLGEASASQAV